jgi:hypothetical protein
MFVIIIQNNLKLASNSEKKWTKIKTYSIQYHLESIFSSYEAKNCAWLWVCVFIQPRVRIIFVKFVVYINS